MARKNFKHPADQFISEVEAEQQEQSEEQARQEALARLGVEAKAAKERKAQGKEQKPESLSLEAGQRQELNKRKGRRAAPVAPDGMKPAYIEKRTKRVQLVFQPSLYEQVRMVADAKGVSFNEYVHKLLEVTMSIKVEQEGK